MAQQDETISCSRAEIFVVAPQDAGVDPFLLGIIEDFTVTGQFSAEILMSIGKFRGVEALVNNEQARFRWGRVFKINDAQLPVLRPTVSHYATFRAFSILVVDIVDQKPALLLNGCVPEMLEINMTNGRALRENYSGQALGLDIGREVVTSN